MSEELSAGVRILLSRFDTNPDEMMEEYGKWQHLREAVFEYKENGNRGGWIRGLRDDEVDALYDLFCSNARKMFDEWVMKQVLTEEQNVEGQQIMNTPRLWDNATNQTSNTSIRKIVNNVNQGRK